MSLSETWKTCRLLYDRIRSTTIRCQTARVRPATVRSAPRPVSLSTTRSLCSLTTRPPTTTTRWVVSMIPCPTVGQRTSLSLLWQRHLRYVTLASSSSLHLQYLTQSSTWRQKCPVIRNLSRMLPTSTIFVNRETESVAGLPVISRRQ